MGKKNFLQTDFLAGELSPRIELQSNLEGRKHGAELMENFFLHLQGSAETSRGTAHLVTVPGTVGRMFGFPVAAFTPFMVAIAAGTLYVLDPFGVARKGNVLTNDYFIDREDGWTAYAGPGTSREFLPGGVRLTCGLNPEHPSYISQTGTVVIGTAYNLTVDIAFGDGPLSIEAGTSAGDTSLVNTVVYGASRHKFENLVSTTTEIWIRIKVLAGDPDVILTGVHLYDPTAGAVSFSCPWSTESDIASLQGHMIPGVFAMLLTSIRATPYRLDYSAGAWALSAPTITDPPSVWTTWNNPPAAAFYGGRLWLGGSPSDPSILWASKSGDYTTFTLGTLADDALEYKLNRSGSIHWIAGGTSLLVGTSNAEHVISSEGGVIIPGDISSQIQSTNGSYPTQALEVGNEVMYLSPDGRKIRSIGFEWLKDAWRSRDLTYASEHITSGPRALRQLRYAANPDSLIVGLTQGGDLTVATYEPYSQTAGFTRRSTDGTIVAIGTAPLNGTDELWMMVHRGGGSLSIEKEPSTGPVKLDDHLRLYDNTPQSSWLAPHLEGVDCQVLVDGAVHPNVTPQAFGLFSTEYAGNEVLIGRQIRSILRTLPIADELANIGTTRSMRKRLAEIWVKIINSWRPKINGRLPSDRRPATPMGSVEPARTESISVTNTGWDDDSQITIEQDLPLRTEIAGWFGRLLQEEV